ncbi:zf-TFIIB domain-containing protein [Paenibacillus pinihumi]|uniref:TFIIB-type zinc ribbon-containing protein n=1 Tax=Paenibacillus pinihumi TaxID=669462 RepID=UPI000407CE22|nr:zf-TFIIB domain-containing protein [Paenibacillus pinihumi]
MNCPVCDNVKMREVEKDGILIDICPSCKGVWLDRGELEKLMEGVREVREPFNKWYEEQEYRQQPPQHEEQRPQGYRQSPYKEGSAYKGDYNGSYKKPYKKKKSVMDIFGDLFD